MREPVRETAGEALQLGRVRQAMGGSGTAGGTRHVRRRAREREGERDALAPDQIGARTFFSHVGGSWAEPDVESAWRMECVVDKLRAGLNA